VTNHSEQRASRLLSNSLQHIGSGDGGSLKYDMPRLESVGLTTGPSRSELGATFQPKVGRQDYSVTG
jgi:hypothetical protein